MKKLTVFGLAILLSGFARSQRLELSAMAGISNYQGDLQPIFFTFQQSNPAAALTLKYGVSKHFYVRTGLLVGHLTGDDLGNKKRLVDRNLRFKTGLQELHAGLEYRLVKEDGFPLIPYVFAGAGIFHFNPYTTVNNTRVYLQPLGTEGQGLIQYPDKKMYKLVQACVMYGFGYNYRVNQNLNIGVEFWHRKLFTDYLDDASGTFADHDVLLEARGQLAVDLAFPSRLLNPLLVYPKEGALRANPGKNDWYYSGLITINLRIFDFETGNFSLGGLFSEERRNRRLQNSCPRAVW